MAQPLGERAGGWIAGMIKGDAGSLQQAIDPVGMDGIGNDDMRHDIERT